jgi:hypothetical protein
MKRTLLTMLCCIAAVCCLTSGASCEEASVSPVQAPAEELSIYGEVLASDAQAGTISVQYYDYDTDEEKTMEIVFDKDTKLENAASVADIKKGDWVDVTYAMSADKHLAKSVFVEKEDEVMAGSENTGTYDE